MYELFTHLAVLHVLEIALACTPEHTYDMLRWICIRKHCRERSGYICSILVEGQLGFQGWIRGIG